MNIENVSIYEVFLALYIETFRFKTRGNIIRQIVEFVDVLAPIFSTIGKSILLMNGKLCALINLILIDENFVLSKW